MKGIETTVDVYVLGIREGMKRAAAAIRWDMADRELDAELIEFGEDLAKMLETEKE